ncbi:MAG: FAD-dependent oxidoreductase [Nocardioidaceae bacterium]
MLRVAVVGSGPAGVYATGALTDHGEVSVDVIDRVPCPYGLVRYGVAPDHPKIQSISETLRAVLDDPAVRFLGNVDVGSQLSVADLHQHYDAVIFAVGSAIDRRLGIAGEDLAGSFSATDFVAWYCGHPDAPLDRFTLSVRSVAVIGAGNVALDVARIVARSAPDLEPTDMPDQALGVLRLSTVQDIHVIARRGPAQAKFTTKELREMGDLSNTDVLVHASELEVDEAGQALADTQPRVRRNLTVLQEWAQRRPAGNPRRLHLHFLLRPVEILGDSAVRAVRVERTQLDSAGNAVGTGRTWTIDAQLVLRSVGYRGSPLPGVPFDHEAGVIPHRAGRVLRDASVVPGEYVAGWAKRGPTGVIGTNRHDATETVTSLLEDVPLLPPAPQRDPDAILELLERRGAHVVTWEGWQAIEHAERELGRTLGRQRSKITDRAALLAAADGSSVPSTD